MIDAEKAFEKHFNSFMIKTLSKLRIEVNFFNLINGNSEKKPTANNIQKNAFFKIGTNSKMMTVLKTSINYYAEALSQYAKQEKHKV